MEKITTKVAGLPWSPEELEQEKRALLEKYKIISKSYDAAEAVVKVKGFFVKKLRISTSIFFDRRRYGGLEPLAFIYVPAENRFFPKKWRGKLLYFIGYGLVNGNQCEPEYGPFFLIKTANWAQNYDYSKLSKFPGGRSFVDYGMIIC